MEILIVSATELEITPLITHLKSHWIPTSPNTYSRGACTVMICITGIGMHRMAYSLGRQFHLHKPDLCINAGIAGTFPGKAEIGDVVHVISEIMADLGAEDANGELLLPDALGLEEDISSVTGLVNHAAIQYAFLKNVKGITVNKAHGTERSIRNAIDTWDPDVETMEGGAFFYCCLKAVVPFLEIRSISNLVEPRKRQHWDIPLAVSNLNAQLVEILGFFVA